MQAWQIAPRRVLTLDRPRIMAILNVTPDSFADGGRYASAHHAAQAADHAAHAGADLIDVGGESTRPGAARVDDEEQVKRVVPVIEQIRRGAGPAAACAISIDTTRARVARAALDAGADIVNDTSAGTDDPAILGLCAQRGCGVILMHRAREPAADRYSDAYDREPDYPGGVVACVDRFLRERVDVAEGAGVDPRAIMLDPGLGFGKNVEQNIALIEGTPALLALGLPVLSALSRKSFVGRVSLGRDSLPHERLAGTLALSVEHLRLGARVFRVHDVPEHAQALAAAFALSRATRAHEQGACP